jgi:hypothetical protein
MTQQHTSIARPEVTRTERAGSGLLHFAAFPQAINQLGGR